MTKRVLSLLVLLAQPVAAPASAAGPTQLKVIQPNGVFTLSKVST
jgi:hypothetical protein